MTIKARDHVSTPDGAGVVIDLHADKVHASVLPDAGPPALVRYRLRDLTPDP